MLASSNGGLGSSSSGSSFGGSSFGGSSSGGDIGGVRVENASVWGGAGGTRTPLHVDMVHALVFQVLRSRR
jgi:hypothetical protein